jgi:hypothetical protein
VPYSLITSLLTSNKGVFVNSSFFVYKLDSTTFILRTRASNKTALFLKSIALRAGGPGVVYSLKSGLRSVLLLGQVSKESGDL